MQSSFSKKFAKQRDRADKKIHQALRSRLRLFSQNPFHPQLNNHALKGKYGGYRSINVTGDWRAIFSETEENGETVVIFQVLGTHSQLYK